ncbi:MAG: transketolase [Lachnospiraceae bacterium]|nr:transketolase [Lachnospiraceae bacterium]
MEISKKNAKTWSRMGPRATYGLALQDLINNNDRVYALSGDLGGSSGLSRLMIENPSHYLNVGIAEQNLIGISAGLAKEGLIPFASSFAPFITHRCEDQVRMNMGYMHLNIKAVGLGSGISMSILGNSHYGMTDLAIMNAIPGLTIFSPCDCAQLAMCVWEAAKIEGPVYIRMTGEPGMPRIYEEAYDFEVGKANHLRKGKDILIAATGSMVYNSLKAADILSEKNIDSEVVDIYTVKPFDKSVLNNEYKLIVTVEEHSIIGGLGSIVNTYAAGVGNFTKVLNIGLPDDFVKAGSYQYMLESLGLTAEQIAERILYEYQNV